MVDGKLMRTAHNAKTNSQLQNDDSFIMKNCAYVWCYLRGKNWRVCLHFYTIALQRRKFYYTSFEKWYLFVQFAVFWCKHYVKFNYPQDHPSIGPKDSNSTTRIIMRLKRSINWIRSTCLNAQFVRQQIYRISPSKLITFTQLLKVRMSSQQWTKTGFKSDFSH